MSGTHTGNTQPSIDREEHRSVNGVNAKAVVPYGFDGTSLVPLQGGLVPDAYDYIAATYPDAVTEVYTYKTGGSGGTTVRTVTVVYTTNAKTNVASVTRT